MTESNADDESEMRTTEAILVNVVSETAKKTLFGS